MKLLINSSEGDSVESGERVSNAWVTYPEVGDNSSKGELIPNVVPPRMWGRLKVESFGICRFWRGPRDISLLVR